MNLEKELPEIGTPEQALEKMKNSYQAFIDSLAKFITIAEYYTEKANEGQPLPSDCQTRYTSHYQSLKNKKPYFHNKEKNNNTCNNSNKNFLMFHKNTSYPILYDNYTKKIKKKKLLSF